MTPCSVTPSCSASRPRSKCLVVPCGLPDWHNRCCPGAAVRSAADQWMASETPELGCHLSGCMCRWLLCTTLRLLTGHSLISSFPSSHPPAPQRQAEAGPAAPPRQGAAQEGRWQACWQEEVGRPGGAQPGSSQRRLMAPLYSQFYLHVALHCHVVSLCCGHYTRQLAQGEESVQEGHQIKRRGIKWMHPWSEGGRWGKNSRCQVDMQCWAEKRRWYSEGSCYVWGFLSARLWPCASSAASGPGLCYSALCELISAWFVTACYVTPHAI